VGRSGTGARHRAGATTPRGYSRNAKTNPRSAVESTKAPKNEPRTNLNEPRTNPTPSTCASPKPFRMSVRCGRVRRAFRTCCSSGAGSRGQRGAGLADCARNRQGSHRRFGTRCHGLGARPRTGPTVGSRRWQPTEKRAQAVCATLKGLTAVGRRPGSGFRERYEVLKLIRPLLGGVSPVCISSAVGYT
jgi:hypothetical protein